MSTASSPAVLREAAALMRERAQAATPGPWRPLTTGVQGGDHWYVCDDGEALASIAAQDGVNEEQREPDATHIASWHPAVALAVADWLDWAAEQEESTRWIPVVGPALAVARAYLGRTADEH